MKKVIIVTGSNRVKRAREIQNKVYRLELSQKCVIVDNIEFKSEENTQVIVTITKSELKNMDLDKCVIVDTDFNV